MLNNSKPIPPDFQIHASARLAAQAIVLEARQVLLDNVEVLMATGLSEEKAASVALDAYARLACEMAMHVAVELDGRQPRKERWLEVTGQIYDQIHETYMAKRAVAGRAAS